MTLPSHAKLDGHIHLITAISDKVGDNAAHTHRVKFGCGLAFDVRGAHQFADDRWLTSSTTTCSTCIAVETGERGSVEPEKQSTTMVMADIPTGLTCPEPSCGAEVRIGRKTGRVACTAYGHEFKVEAALVAAFSLIERLAKGDLTKKDQ